MLADRRFLFLLIGFMFACSVFISPQALFAAEYSGSSGIRFQYPDSWIAVSAATINQIDERAKEYIRDKGLDLNSAEACLLDANFDGFAENLNIVVTPGENTTNEKTLDKSLAEIRKMYEQAAIPVQSMTGKVVQAAGRSCFEIDQLTTMEGNLLRQTQLIIPGGGKTFFVTLTTLASNHDQYLPVMEQVKSSLQLPAAKGFFDWGQAGTSGMVGGIVGCIVATVASVFGRLRKKPEPQLDLDDSADESSKR